MKKLTLIALLATALWGCSSTKLTEESKTIPTTHSDAINSGVASINISPTQLSNEGPKQTAHVIYFDYDSFAIKKEDASNIERHAQYLRANPKRKLQLEGHTDERGGREYNLGLGQKRAETVQRALGFYGISPTQVESVSLGKEKPAIQGNDEQAWAKNRRVEFSYR